MRFLILSLFALIAFALAGCVTPDTAAIVVIPDDAPEFVVPEDGPATPVEPAKPAPTQVADVADCPNGVCPLPAAQDGESVRRFTPVKRARGVLGRAVFCRRCR